MKRFITLCDMCKKEIPQGTGRGVTVRLDPPVAPGISASESKIDLCDDDWKKFAHLVADYINAGENKK